MLKLNIGKNIYAHLLGFSFVIGVAGANNGDVVLDIRGETSESSSAASERKFKYVPAHESRESVKWIQDNLASTAKNTLQAPHRLHAATLPNYVDLRPKMPKPYDQGSLGSCTAHALAASVQYVAGFMPSRLQIYYGERKIEGTIPQDAGASLADGIIVLHQTGACHENLWPYSDNSLQFKVQPSAACLTDASGHKDTDPMNFAQVSQNLASIKQALTQRPVVAGIMLYDSFESDTTAKTGIVNLPKANERFLGGHAVTLVGYDDRSTVNGRTNPNYQRFMVRNSWGPTWGQSGHFTIPYSYVLNPNLAMDFWTVATMT